MKKYSYFKVLYIYKVVFFNLNFQICPYRNNIDILSFT